jgi:hypothetical protein
LESPCENPTFFHFGYILLIMNIIIIIIVIIIIHFVVKIIESNNFAITAKFRKKCQMSKFNITQYRSFGRYSRITRLNP